MEYKNIINEALADMAGVLAEGRRWAVQSLMDEGMAETEAKTMVREYLEQSVSVFSLAAGGVEK